MHVDGTGSFEHINLFSKFIFQVHCLEAKVDQEDQALI